MEVVISHRILFIILKPLINAANLNSKVTPFFLKLAANAVKAELVTVKEFTNEAGNVCRELLPNSHNCSKQVATSENVF